jgi:hypothetical protein
MKEIISGMIFYVNYDNGQLWEISARSDAYFYGIAWSKGGT